MVDIHNAETFGSHEGMWTMYLMNGALLVNIDNGH